ncbi:hypothetical protein J4407_02310, partial [Candidatus Pacearchaeota archaeon]|nr:hypothetical protein [Candidatus Pacearchaeota archaeon]
MAPTIDVSSEVLEGLDKLGVPYKIQNPKIQSQNNKNKRTLSKNTQEDYIELPSGILVAKQKILHGKNWSETHGALQEQGKRMLI